MTDKPTPEQMRDVVNQAEIGRRWGVGRSAVGNWPDRYPDYPAPLNPDSEYGNLYWWPEIEEWHVARFGTTRSQTTR